MESTQVYVERGQRFASIMPYSEVCMSMRVAGKIMECEIVGTRPTVQLYNPESHVPFSFPILTGEAGVYTDSNGELYVTSRDFVCWM